MIRLLKLILGVPLVIAGLLLGIVALVGFFIDTTAGSRTVAVSLGVIATLILLLGRRLTASRSNTGTAGCSMYSGSEQTINSFEFVQISSGGRISVNASSATEAKLGVKELRLLKKSFGLQKRVVLDQQKAIRANYTHQVRSRGSMLRGGGAFGRFIRAFQAAGRDSSRSQLANALQPLENEKQRLDRAMAQIDSLTTQVESQILRMT